MIVDLSSYQRGFDFQAFKAGGGLAAILKATEGENWRDPCYHDFYAKAAAAGVPVATYHFIRASAGGGEAQAKCLMSYAGFDHGERVIVDWEDRAVPFQEVLAFLETIRTADLTLQLTVYGSPYFLQAMLFRQATSWLRANTSLWLAEYNTALQPSKVPMAWQTWSLWQYSQSGHVPGFGGPVDLSRFNGPDSKALSWFGVPEPSPTPLAA